MSIVREDLMIIAKKAIIIDHTEMVCMQLKKTADEKEKDFQASKKALSEANRACHDAFCASEKAENEWEDELRKLGDLNYELEEAINKLLELKHSEGFIKRARVAPK